MNLSTPQSPKPPSPFKLLLIGGPGCRKTTLALQFPDVHVYDADHNLDGPVSVIRNGIVDKITKQQVVAPINPNLVFSYDDLRANDKGEMLEIYECYERFIDKLVFAASDKDLQSRKTHVTDSLSHVNEFIIRKVLKEKNKNSMEISLWNDFASAAYTILVAKLDRLNRTVICTCHEEIISEADKTNIMNRVIVGINPLFSGKVGDSLGSFFTDVWRLERRNAPGNKIEVWLQTDKSTKCNSLKNSVGLPPELDITKGFSVIEPYLKGRI